MVELAILIPVLRRPRNIQPLVSSVRSCTTGQFELLFVVSPGDSQEIQELENQKESYIIMDASYENAGDYARKINRGFQSIEAEWYFLGADDLRFYPRWLESAMETYNQTGNCVIGTNDLGNPRVLKGEHSTHSLVLRDYVLRCGTIDEPGKILYEGYHHNFCDDELISTAKWRDAWAFSKESIVAHYHPNWKLAQRDEIYDLGMKSFHEDQKIYDYRRRLWM